QPPRRRLGRQRGPAGLAEQGRLGPRTHRRRAHRRRPVRARAGRPALALPHAPRERGWVLVVRGQPTLRTPEGEQVLEEGDVVAFPRGNEGLHQIKNRTNAPIRVLMLSTLIRPDLVHYADSGKFGAGSVKGERILLSRPGPMLDYWDGED